MASPRLVLPRRLAVRLDELRDDEAAREQFRKHIADIRRADALKRRQLLHKPAAAAPAAPRANASHGAAAAPAATTEPPSLDLLAAPPPAPSHDDDAAPPPREASQSAEGGRRAPAARAHSPRSPRGRSAPVSPRPRREVAPPPPPHLPGVQLLLERARGDRTRDPAELRSGPATSTVRAREKRLELAGDFHFGGASAVERLTHLASRLEREEGPQAVAAVNGNWTQRGASLGEPYAKSRPGHFVFSRVERSAIADAAMLHNHRLPFIMAAARESESSQHGPRPRRLLRKLRDKPTRRPRVPTSYGRNEIDDVEMQTARLLLSTGLTIYRTSRW
ncbi:hypothetical protein AB1Y20_007293 [Prymnesium parvum]|uniref:Uncharacterized protein n=1 Tax=Prymnesium parvum TaxID=97485 RepID=A0AB34IXI4_PRYPA